MSDYKMYQTIPDKKKEEAKKIREDVEKFLENGGEIRKLKNGETNVEFNKRKSKPS